MARGRRRDLSPCCRRYGSPLYCAAWVPAGNIAAREGAKEEERKGEEGDDQKTAPPSDAGEWLVVLGGGGGEGRSGVPNAVLVSQFHPESGSLSDQPTCRIETEKEVPYRMAVHPGGFGVLCSFPKSCRWFEWHCASSGECSTLALKRSERSLAQLEDVGMQLALAFSGDGSLLAAGGEDGYLRLFKWSNMDVIIDKSDAHASVKHLDFSSDGKLLVSLGDNGPCRIWDTNTGSVIANLPRENGENFSFCRFSQRNDNKQILYISTMRGGRGQIVSWDPLSWKRIGSVQITHDPISAFNISTNGKLLAVGTIEGDIIVADALSKRVLNVVKKAHLGLVTALEFKDSRALVSASFDASARVTLLTDKKGNGFNVWIGILVIVLAVLIYYYMNK